MTPSKWLQELDRAIAKSEAADYTVKYDVLHTACKRIVRENLIKPVTDWKNGSYEAETQTKI